MKKKSIISSALVIVLLLTLVFPATVFADDETYVYDEYQEDTNYVEDSSDDEVDNGNVIVQDDNDDSEDNVESNDNDDSDDDLVYEDGNDVNDNSNLVNENNDLQDDSFDEEAPPAFLSSNGDVSEEDEEIAPILGNPVITTNPEPYTGLEGETAVFTVAATGTGELKYQWQWSSDNATWNNAGVTGNKTDTIQVPITQARNGLYYRCVVKDGSGASAASNGAKLTLTTLKITKQPEPFSGALDTAAMFSVTATGTGALKYQWQWSNDNATWNNAGVTGNKTDTITFTITQARNGMYYRCVVKDGSGASVASDGAQLTVSSLKITQQPEPFTGPLDTVATFSVVATGTGTLKYQWQWSSDNATWNNAGVTGNKTDTLTVPITQARNGLYYRCVVKDGSGASVSSNAAQLTVSNLKITKQPENFTGALDSAATFSVTATGTGTLTYQWKWSENGTSWNNAGLTGNKTDTLTVPITEARDGLYYRCVVKDESGMSVSSDAAQLTLSNLKITKQPEPFSAPIGIEATFTVEATGTGTLKYQWQWSDNGTDWYNAGATGNRTDTLTLAVTQARNGMLYRCVVTDGTGLSVASEGAMLTVGGDFIYEAIDNTTARLKKYYGADAAVTVDSTYEGKTVTEIGEKAFENNTTITSVSLPNSIVIIGARAFAGCTNLSTMTTHS